MTAAESVLWPEREPLYDLMHKRASEGVAAFESEKQNSPVDPSLCEWGPEYFEGGIWFDAWPERLAIKTLALDPSKGPKDNKRDSDYSAIVRYGRAHSGVEYVEADLKKRPTEQIVEDAIEAYIDFGPEELVVETNTFQELLIAPLLAEAKRRGIDLAVCQMVSTVPKEVRIRRHGPYLHRKQVRFKKRSPGTMLLVQQLKDFPNGDHDDGCFVAGTLIATPEGERPIEAIRPGEQVLTRHGVATVTHAGCTGVKPVIEVFAAGRVLAGTSSHPVFDGHSFVRMREICTIASCESTRLPSQKRSLLTASSSGGILVPSNGRTGPTTHRTPGTGGMGWVRCTKRFGRPLTVRFLLIARFTTGMTIRSITRLTISNASRVRSMADDTVKPGASGRLFPMLLAALRPSGIARRWVGHGMPVLAGSRGKPVSRPGEFASSVVANTSRARREADSVRRVAASDCMLPMVVTPVVAVSAKGRHPVYNLTVDRVHEYIANGFVVHNCDAWEMARSRAIELFNGRRAKNIKGYRP